MDKASEAQANNYAPTTEQVADFVARRQPVQVQEYPRSLTRRRQREEYFTGDLVKQYLQEIGRYPLLTRAQEVELSQRVQTGLQAQAIYESDQSGSQAAVLEVVIDDGLDAKQMMFVSNLRLVVSIAKRYAKKEQMLIDLIQDGNIGLAQAIDKFDGQRGFKFSTYADGWIRQAVIRGMARLNHVAKVPANDRDAAITYNRLLTEAEQSGVISSEIDEHMRLLGFDIGRIETVKRVNNSLTTVSLDSPIGDGDNTRGELLGDPAGIAAIEQTEDAISAQALFQAVREIIGKPIVYYVMAGRFGFETNGEPVKFDDLASQFKKSREAIRRYYALGSAMLQHPSAHSRIVRYLPDHIAKAESWKAKAACAEADIEAEMFEPSVKQDQTILDKYCRVCPVRDDCMDYAAQNRIAYGVWGKQRAWPKRHVKKSS